MNKDSILYGKLPDKLPIFKLQKNQIIDINPDYINANFEAVKLFKNKKLIIEEAIPGEIVIIKITKIQQNVAFAINIKFKNYISLRNKEQKCKNEYCSGCSLKYLKPKIQTTIKQNLLKELFSKYNPQIFYPYEQLSTIKYRNKINIPVDIQEGKFIFGLYKKNSHKITPWKSNCPVLLPSMFRVLKLVIKNLNLNFDTLQELEIKNIFLRAGNHGVQVGVTYHNYSNPNNLNHILSDIYNGNKKIITSIFSNYGGNQGNSVSINNPCFINSGEKENSFLEMKILDKNFQVAPGSFFQINKDITEKIIADIIFFFKHIEITLILDICSGVGVLSAFFINNIKRICCDINPASFTYFKEDEYNIALCCDMSKLPLFADEAKNSVYIFDPPRKGLSLETIRIIEKKLPKYIIYLSCNPFTQKRDIDFLNNKYQLEMIKGYDMFPDTHHIENLIILKLKI